MRLLLLGGTGQVGEEFRALPPPKDVEVLAPSRAELDLQDPRAVAQIIAAEAWSAVINVAAYTDVDRAESEEAVAFAVNAEAPARLATETGRRGIPLIHISTDYVFDGRKGTPYVEEDEPAPLNAYGRSKLAGEHGIRAGNRRHVILRSSWIYSPYRKNFVRTILRLAARTRQPDYCRRSARLPDCCTGHRPGVPRYRFALRLGTRSATLWHLSFRRRGRSNLV